MQNYFTWRPQTTFPGPEKHPKHNVAFKPPINDLPMLMSKYPSLFYKPIHILFASLWKPFTVRFSKKKLCFPLFRSRNMFFKDTSPYQFIFCMPIFGSRNNKFTTQDIYQFHISPCQLYQRIPIDSGNPFIYSFHHFGSLSGQFSMKNYVLFSFGS